MNIENFVNIINIINYFLVYKMERYNVSKFRGGDPQSSNLYNGPRLNVREANGNFVQGGY